MFVFPLVEKEFSKIFVAEATVQTGQQPVRKAATQNKTSVKAKTALTGMQKTSLQIKTAAKSKNVAAGTTRSSPLVKTTTNSKSVVAVGTKLAPQNKTTSNAPSAAVAVSKTGTSDKNANSLTKVEFFQKKSYVEEPIVKDQFWNIYTGNPGFYATEGDNVNFGTVTTLSDSAFLEAQRTVVVKTVKPYGIPGKELIIPNQDWILGVILIFWMIFASVRAGFLKYLGQLFLSIVNYSAANRLYQERGYKTMYGALRLDLIFHLILPLSVFQIAGFFKINIPGYPEVLFFLALLLIINGYLFTKILLMRVAGSIVMLKEQTEETVFNIKLYYKALGLILLPFVTIHAVRSETNFITIWIMSGVIAIMYVAAVIRSIYVGNRKDISIFYLILYLCTLEILPLLLIFKLMSSE